MEISERQTTDNETCPNCKKLFSKHINTQLLNCALTELEKPKLNLAAPLRNILDRFERGEDVV